jgi:translocation and assembly module TamB
MTDPESTPIRRSLFRRVALGAGLLAMALVLALTASFFLLQSEAGREWLRGRLSALLSSEPDQTVELGKITGFLPWDIRLESLVVGDAEGPWLHIDGIVLRWAPAGLLRGELHIEELRADSIEAARIPQSREEKSPREPGIPSIAFRAPPLTIHSISIPSISLGHEVLGHAASLEMLGFILPSDPPGGRTAFLQVNRLDQGQDLRAYLDARFDKSAESMKLQLEVVESADGMLSHVLGLSGAGALSLRLDGDGPSSGWRGGMDVRASHWGSVTTALSLTLDEGISAEIAGVAVDSRPWPSSEKEANGAREALFHLKARYLDGKLLILDHFTAEGEGFSLEADGKLDLESRGIESRLALTLSDLGVPASAATVELKGEGRLCAMAYGTLDAPRVHLSADLRDLVAGELGAAHVFTQVQLEAASQATDPKVEGWRVSADGRASGLKDSSGSPLPEASLDWLLDAEIPAERDSVLLKTLRLAGTHHRLEATGRVEISSMAGSLEAALRVTDLRTVTGLLGRELPGTLDLDFQMSGAGGTRSATGAIAGKLAVQGAPNGEPLVSLLGPETALSADFEILEGTSVQVSNTLIQSPALQVRGGGSFNVPAGSVNAAIQASIPELKALSALLNEELSGRAESSLKVEGPLDDLTVTHSLKGHQVRWRQQPPTDIQSSFQASHIPRKVRGQWKLLVTQAAEKLDASLGFERQEERLRLTAMHLDGPGARLSGDLALNLEAGTAEGAVQGRFEDLGRLGRFIGEPLAGSGSFEARLSAPRGSQNATVKINARNLSSSVGKVARVDVGGDLKDLWKTIGGNLQAELAELERGKTVIRSASLKVGGDRSGLSFTGRANGRLMQDVELQLAGSLIHSNDVLRLELSDFRGKFGDYPVQLKDRLLIEHTPRGASLDGLSLALGPGTVAANGRLTESRAQGRLTLENIPLQMVALFGGPDWAGKARASLDIDGTPAQPVGSLELQLAEVRVRALEAKDLPPALISARARLEGGTLRGDLSLEQLLEKPARVDYAVPMRVSLSPRFSFELPPEAPLQARAELEGELGRLAGLLPLTDQTISGRTRASLNVTGSMAEPVFNGEVRLSDGLYENLGTGTVLKQVDAEITARDQRLEITRFQATDGERGQISLGGWLELDAANRFPMEIEAILREATLARRSDLDAAADGKVKVSRSAGAMRVEGDLTVAPAEYRIPERLPAGAVELEVTEIDKSGRKIVPEEPVPPSEVLPLGLTLTLIFPNRTFVRGRGLDSEWRGRLNIAGTAAQPALTGQLSVVRGRFDFLDRRFDFNQGTITFLGTSPPDPHLDFRAQARARDITALLRVIGAASSPEIQLGSDPPLPQEEVLARLLFGRSVDRVSPIQALKLAQALKSLSGTSRLPGMDFLGATRRLLGLDQLELRSADGGSETGLGFGKYLTEDVYVDVEKDLRGAGGRVSVNVELTPNISVESEVGADAQTGIRINWKHDY